MFININMVTMIIRNSLYLKFRLRQIDFIKYCCQVFNFLSNHCHPTIRHTACGLNTHLSPFYKLLGHGGLSK